MKAKTPYDYAGLGLTRPGRRGFAERIYRVRKGRWAEPRYPDYSESGSLQIFLSSDDAPLTPCGAFGRPDPDRGNYRFGSRFGMNRSLDLALEGQRREIRAGNPEHELTVRGRLNWQRRIPGGSVMTLFPVDCGRGARGLRGARAGEGGPTFPEPPGSPRAW